MTGINPFEVAKRQIDACASRSETDRRLRKYFETISQCGGDAEDPDARAPCIIAGTNG